MVSEILQYIVDDIQIPNLEASSMYAGIMIDTNSFMNRTGVRTFEAAAFLRRSGADITLVRKMFRDDMEGYRAKAAIISNAEVYQKKFAIATGTDLQVESPMIILHLFFIIPIPLTIVMHLIFHLNTIHHIREKSLNFFLKNFLNISLTCLIDYFFHNILLV